MTEQQTTLPEGIQDALEIYGKRLAEANDAEREQVDLEPRIAELIQELDSLKGKHRALGMQATAARNSADTLRRMIDRECEDLGITTPATMANRTIHRPPVVDTVAATWWDGQRTWPLRHYYVDNDHTVWLWTGDICPGIDGTQAPLMQQHEDPARQVGMDYLLRECGLKSTGQDVQAHGYSGDTRVDQVLPAGGEEPVKNGRFRRSPDAKGEAGE